MISTARIRAGLINETTLRMARKIGSDPALNKLADRFGKAMRATIMPTYLTGEWRRMALDEIPCGTLEEIADRQEAYILLRASDVKGFNKKFEGRTLNLKLNGIDLSYALLEGVKLPGAILKGAEFRSANLKGADLSGAQLEGADFLKAYAPGANFRGAELADATFSDTDLSGTDFTDAYMRSVFLVRADCSNASFERADLGKARIIGADFAGVRFIDTILASVDMIDPKNLGRAHLEGEVNVWEFLGAINDGTTIEEFISSGVPRGFAALFKFRRQVLKSPE